MTWIFCVSVLTTSQTFATATTVQIAGSLTSAPVTLAEEQFPVTLPLNVTVAGLTFGSVCITVKGSPRFGTTDCANLATLCHVYPYSFQIYEGYAHGIDYRVDGLAPDRSVTFRWYVAKPGMPEAVFNFSTTYYEAPTNIVFNSYFSLPVYLPISYVGIKGPADTSLFDASYGKLVSGSTLLWDTVKKKVTQGKMS